MKALSPLEKRKKKQTKGRTLQTKSRLLLDFLVVHGEDKIEVNIYLKAIFEMIFCCGKIGRKRHDSRKDIPNSKWYLVHSTNN